MVTVTVTDSLLKHELQKSLHPSPVVSLLLCLMQLEVKSQFLHLHLQLHLALWQAVHAGFATAALADEASDFKSM
jgi:hypothetical protein